MNEVKKRIFNVSGTNGHFIAFTTIVKRSNRKFADLMAELTRAGERLRKEDLATNEGPLGQLVQIRGAGGKSNTISSMMIVDEILLELQKYGEGFSADEWTSTRREGRESALDFASRIRVLPKVFRPEVWVNRTEEMERLWQYVSDSARGQISNFQERKTKAEQLSRPVIDICEGLRLAELTEINPQIGYAPFQDHRTWKKWDQIVVALGVKGKTFASASRQVVANAFTLIDEPADIITKVDLFKKGSGDRPYLKIAAEAGVLPDVIKYLGEHGETLDRDDFIAAGLGDLTKDADAKLFHAAENGDDEAIRSFASMKIAHLEAKHGQSLLTPLMGATAKNQTTAMLSLLDVGADPDARSGKVASLSTLWLACKHTDATGVTFIVEGLRQKYHNDPIKVLDCLLTIHDSAAPAEVARKADKKDSAKVVDDAIENVVDIVVMMPGNLLAEHVTGRKSGLELLTDAKKLPKLFTPKRWYGDAKGMHALAGQVAKDAIAGQLTGKNGVPAYADVLAQVNASVLKRGLMGAAP